MSKKSKALIQYNSPVILTFTFICFAVLIIGEATSGLITINFFSAYWTGLDDPLMYLRLFTHVLGHADVSHFTGNLLIILLVGPMIEEKYGSKRLFILMLFTAFITGLINIMFFSTALLGASGIVFMLILLSSYANFEKGRIPLTLILVVAAFIIQEIIAGLFNDDNISHLTHIVGGSIGGIFGYLITGRSVKKAERDISDR